MTEFGPLASAEVILLDEINRIPVKSQSAFLEGLQDRTVTVGKTSYELPEFSFALATMNPVELGQGTFPLSEAATDRFAILVNIAYLPPEEEQKLVSFDFKKVHLEPLASKHRIIEFRAAIAREVFLHEALAQIHPAAGRGDAAAERLEPVALPLAVGVSSRNTWSSAPRRAPPSSGAVSRNLGVAAASAARRCAPRTSRTSRRYVLGHRLWLSPQAAGQGITVET